MSPSVWWDRRAILRYVRAAHPKPRLKMWVDIGTAEGRQHVTNLRLLRAGLIKSGWVEGEDLHYEEIEGGAHSEGAWADRFGRVLAVSVPVLRKRRQIVADPLGLTRRPAISLRTGFSTAISTDAPANVAAADAPNSVGSGSVEK